MAVTFAPNAATKTAPATHSPKSTLLPPPSGRKIKKPTLCGRLLHWFGWLAMVLAGTKESREVGDDDCGQDDNDAQNHDPFNKGKALLAMGSSE